MPEPIAKPIANTKAQDDNATAVLEGPPEEAFWDKYNKRLEFPLSTVAAVLVHVLIGAVVVFGIFQFMNRDDDKSGVPVKLVDLAGLDDGGMGSAGSGGKEEDVIRAKDDGQRAAIESLADPKMLPEIKEKFRKMIVNIDPTGKMPISDANAASLASLDESIRKKFSVLVRVRATRPAKVTMARPERGRAVAARIRRSAGTCAGFCGSR